MQVRGKGSYRIFSISPLGLYDDLGSFGGRAVIRPNVRSFLLRI